MPTRYRLNDLYVAVQGEGRMTGTPMVLLRLHGCDVRCAWCDTTETWQPMTDRDDDGRRDRIEDVTERRTGTWTEQTGQAIASFARALAPAVSWAMVTGGEPLMQAPLADLVASLRCVGFMVQLETSGTRAPDCAVDWLTVSPKFRNPGGRPLVEEALAAANELKFVVGRREDIDEVARLLESSALPRPGQLIWLQPMSQSGRATSLCVTACVERGWSLSVQVNKYLGLP